MFCFPNDCSEDEEALAVFVVAAAHAASLAPWRGRKRLLWEGDGGGRPARR